MTLFAFRIALLLLAGGLTTLGLGTLSPDGQSLTIHIGPMAEFLNDWALQTGLTAGIAWATMWARAKKTGKMT